MKESDNQKFSQLMAIASEATPGNQPSDEKIKIYFEALRDLEFDYIRENTINHLRTKHFFPHICDIRNEPTEEEMANKAFQEVEDLLNKFYDPGLHSVTLGIIKSRTSKECFKLIQRFGTEIFYAENITASRAQFIKAYIADTKIGDRRMIKERSGKPVQIGKIVKQIEGVKKCEK